MNTTALDLLEMTYSLYDTYVMVEFKKGSNITKISQLLRSMPMVTVVSNKTDKEDKNPRGVLHIKILTIKPGLQSFQELKQHSLAKIPDLKTFKFSTKRLRKIDEL